MTSIFSPDSWNGTYTILLAVIFGSSVLQASTGFGFAILSAPILTALVGGPAAVTTITIAGTACDIFILGARRERPRPDVRQVVILGCWSVPGLLIGAYALSSLPQQTIQVVVAVAVVVAVLFRIRSRRARRLPSDRALAVGGPLAGFASGLLSTATTLGGPPVVYYLSQRLRDPALIRDTLVTLSLARLPLSVLALLVSSAWSPLPGTGWLVVASVLGFVLGTKIFHTLDGDRYESSVLSLLIVAALVSSVTAFS